MKIFKSVLALSVLLTMLVACGGDFFSSSVSPDPRPCEDQNEDCDDTSSSSEKISKNSSSSQKSADKGDRWHTSSAVSSGTTLIRI